MMMIDVSSLEKAGFTINDIENSYQIELTDGKERGFCSAHMTVNNGDVVLLRRKDDKSLLLAEYLRQDGQILLKSYRDSNLPGIIEYKGSDFETVGKLFWIQPYAYKPNRQPIAEAPSPQ